MTEKPASSRSAGLVTVDLGAALKTEWVQWCQARNLVPGKAARRLIEKAVVEGSELPTRPHRAHVMVNIAHEPDDGLKTEHKVYLTPSEKAAIAAAAQAQQFGFQEWVIAAVRAALTQAPSFGQAEITELVKSNLTLVQVVSELSALRRASTDADMNEKIKALEVGLKKHVEVVSASISQGAKRWLLKM